MKRIVLFNQNRRVLNAWRMALEDEGHKILAEATDRLTGLNALVDLGDKVDAIVIGEAFCVYGEDVKRERDNSCPKASIIACSDFVYEWADEIVSPVALQIAVCLSFH